MSDNLEILIEVIKDNTDRHEKSMVAVSATLVELLRFQTEAEGRHGYQLKAEEETKKQIDLIKKEIKLLDEFKSTSKRNGEFLKIILRILGTIFTALIGGSIAKLFGLF